MNIKTMPALIGLSLALILAACQSPVPEAPTATLPPPPSPTPVALATQPETGNRTPGCTVASLSLPDGPPTDSPIPPVSAQDWTRGPAEAPVTITEYGDFQ